MTITPTTLFRASGVAAAVAGLIFAGVQINHPHLDATSITTTDVIARSSLKLLMAALALAGLTGMYLRQVTKIGLLGLLGYVLFAAGYLLMLGTEFVAAFVLPTLAHTAPAYVSDVEVVDRRVRCLVRGSFQPLLEALRDYEVIGFTSIPTQKGGG